MRPPLFKLALEESMGYNFRQCDKAVREVDRYSITADRQQIDVADSCKGYLLAVGRDVGTHQSQNSPWCSRGEISNASFI